MDFFVGSLLLLCMILPACTTPPEIKQAVVAKDVRLRRKPRVDEPYIVNSSRVSIPDIGTGTAMQRNWPCSIKRSKWATTDPEPPSGQTKENHASMVLLSLLGMNRQRSRQTGSAPGRHRSHALARPSGTKGQGRRVVFEKGHSDMNALVQGVPELIDAIQKKVEAEYAEDMKAADYSAFDDYQTNLAALRRVNGMIKRYLDIDVTVRHDDIDN